MGKWIAGIFGSVITAPIVWQVTSYLDEPTRELPGLRVSSWATPEAVQPGKAIEVFVKVLDDSDRPVSDAFVQIIPTAGSFLWAASSAAPITGKTDPNGLYTMTFQTVVLAGVVGVEPQPANSDTGVISILVRKEGYSDSRATLTIHTR